MDILPSLIGIILEVLGLSSFYIDEGTTADDVPGWNSLSHANILMAIEECFDIEFDLNVILSAKNVGDLVAIINVQRELN